jgi:hypothetical protein
VISQIQIVPEPTAIAKDKGDFFESLLRSIMETQRYRVIERINFTGTEIDLLCQHMDRDGDTALVECKARTSIASSDVKNFAYDVLVSKRAKYGFFVTTSELQHQAAGTVEELRKESQLTFWGPGKVIELLQHSRIVSSPPLLESSSLTPTKRILLYTYVGRFWVTLLSNKIMPTHYEIVSATSPNDPVPGDALRLVADLEEAKNLNRVEASTITSVPKPSISFDSVAEIQEAEQWDDYRPVGSRFFVGRSDVRHKLYQFVQAPRTASSGRRVFFVESKSGWGKSSLIAELRARSRNTRNKNRLYVLAVDSRSANTGAFVSLSLAKLVSMAAKDAFVPEQFSQANIASSFDTLASIEMKSLLSWLQANKRVLILVFDQFEDVFRKSDLFQAFHKFMMDINDGQANVIVGFSWKSEINIPIDNPAYGLWQQTRDLAEPFRLDEFLGFEVDRVLRQLEEASGHQLPSDLRRRLKESSQGFPWLTKRLSIHCYHQMQKGVSPEELVDQNLNVDLLMKEDMETLSPEEARALQLIARRGYEGDPFDVAEVDEKVGGAEVYSLLNKRLIVRSGSRYNVYWDIFRDFLVEGKVPKLGESFLLRQFPGPCLAKLELLLEHNPMTLSEILDLSFGLTEGTALNRIRELRYMGAITKQGDHYIVRASLRSVDEFRSFMRDRLNEHVVVTALRKYSGPSISHQAVIESLKASFKGYGFGSKTWETYASYFTAWLRYAGVDSGLKLADVARRSIGPVGFIPERRPDQDCDVFFSFRAQEDTFPRTKSIEKPLYDLKALGLVVYAGKTVVLTKRGIAVLKLDDDEARQEIARLALSLPKIRQAYDALKESRNDRSVFDDNLAPLLSLIRSDSYRKVAAMVLKAWARFASDHLDGPQAEEPMLFAD